MRGTVLYCSSRLQEGAVVKHVSWGKCHPLYNTSGKYVGGKACIIVSWDKFCHFEEILEGHVFFWYLQSMYKVQIQTLSVQYEHPLLIISWVGGGNDRLSSVLPLLDHSICYVPSCFFLKKKSLFLILSYNVDRKYLLSKPIFKPQSNLKM